jgi:hypothetical protein
MQVLGQNAAKPVNIIRKIVRRRSTGVAFIPNESEEAMPAKQTSESIEAEAGLPIVERMAALGMSQAAIDHAQIWLDALSKVVSGRADELPDHLKREIACEADAELVGAELPADIVQNYGKG